MQLGYVIVYVPDVPAAVRFYENAFGMTHRFLHESGQYAEMETGSTALAFAAEDLVAATCPTFRPNRREHPPAGAEVGLVVDDVHASYAHAIAHGAAGYLEPVAKPWGQIVSYVRDLNGFLVEICSRVTGGGLAAIR